MNYIFFDVDGTLHREDIFVAFIKFAISKRRFNCLIFLPMIAVSFILYSLKPKAKSPLNGILFLLFLGISEYRLNFIINEFCGHFKKNYTIFKNINEKLQKHILDGSRVVIISGTPVELIAKIYPNYANDSNIDIIASTMKKQYFSYFLKERCIDNHKKTMLYNYYDKNLVFSHGYSDSLSDKPILELCREAYMVGKFGELTPYCK